MASPTPRLAATASCPTFLALAVLLMVPAAAQQSQSSTPAAQQPVLVELFTSEGCSDCPPADALLAQLDAHQFVPGAQAIVLSEHVTYWDHLGWRDPFSLPAIDQRQQNYAQQFGLSSGYTPEMVVDGTQEFVGSDSAKLNRAVAHAASLPKVALAIADAHRAPDGSVAFTLRAAPQKRVTLVAALAENETRSEVGRGENAGRTLHHVAVVRAIKEFGASAADGRQLQLSDPDPPSAKRDDEPLRLVVFLVKDSDGRVVGVAEQTLTR